VIRLRARRPFALTAKRKLAVGETFRASAQLADRLIRRGDAEPAPAKPKPPVAAPPEPEA
jgi:hypothetical protein